MTDGPDLSQLFDDFEDDDDSSEEASAKPPKRKTKPPASGSKGKPAAKASDESTADGETPADASDPEGSEKKPDADAEPPPKPTLESLRSRSSRNRVRPGEKSSIRSPFVLGLGAAALLLLLSAATFYFIIGRETAERQYAVALELKETGKYNQAIIAFEQFLEKYPRHSLTEPAEYALGESTIESYIRGSSGAFDEGLTELENYISKFRERETFGEKRRLIREYALDISEQTAARAEKAADPETLTISENSETIFIRYLDPEDPQEEVRTALELAQERAAEAILLRETFEEFTSRIEAVLAPDNGTPDTIAALDLRRELLRSYPQLRSRPEVQSLTARILKTEVDLVTIDAEPVSALSTPDSTFPGRSVSLVVHSRQQTDAKPVDRNVVAVAGGCCYGMDTVTGQPIWRRVIGENTPFFPRSMQPLTDGFLLFEPATGELVLVHQGNGEAIWRQPLGDRPSGSPLVYQGQVFLPTEGGQLIKLSLETGRISRRIQFTQKLLPTPVYLEEAERLVVFGDNTLAYTLTLNPLECVAVTETGQAPGSIQVPVQRMGRFLYLVENTGPARARLRLFRMTDGNEQLIPTAEDDLTGVVLDPPAFRGPDLLVPSRKERVTAFRVNDIVGQDILSRVGVYENTQNPRQVPLRLTIGPDDLFWMSSTAVRKLQIQGTGIVVNTKDPVAPGIHTQPLVTVGDSLYTARQMPYGSAAYFTISDRERMEVRAGSILGNEILAVSMRDGRAYAQLESGHVIEVSPSGLDKSFIEESRLAIDLIGETFDEEFFQTAPEAGLEAVTLADGRIAAWRGLPEPHIWVSDPRGRFDLDLPLPAPLEAPPVLMAEGLVLPVAGRLLVGRVDAGNRRVTPFIVDAGGQSPPWIAALRIDDQHLVTLDRSGHLRRFQFLSTAAPRLQQTSELELNLDVVVAPVAFGQRLALATVDGRLLLLDTEGWDTLAERTLPAAAAGDVRVVENLLLLETDRRSATQSGFDRELHAFDASTLTPKWSEPVPLPRGLADAPLDEGENLVIVDRSGMAHRVVAETGQVRHSVSLTQGISVGPIRFDDSLFVGTIDGTLRELVWAAPDQISGTTP